MKAYILPFLQEALRRIGAPQETPIVLDLPRDHARCDLSTGVALSLAATLGRPPLEIAREIVAALPAGMDLLQDVSVAGPGFINIRFAPEFFRTRLVEAIAAGTAYGRHTPTGTITRLLLIRGPERSPLAIARGAAVADALAAILEWNGVRSIHEPDSPEPVGRDEHERLATLHRTWLAAGERVIDVVMQGGSTGMPELLASVGAGPGEVEMIVVGDAVKIDAQGTVLPESGTPLSELEPDTLRFLLLDAPRSGRLGIEERTARAHSARNRALHVQYAAWHAAALLRHAEWLGVLPKETVSPAPLGTQEEMALIRQILFLPEALRRAARELEPAVMTGYLHDLATAFREFHRTCRIIPEEPALREARLMLVRAARMAMVNGLRRIGVAPAERV